MQVPKEPYPSTAPTDKRRKRQRKRFQTLVNIPVGTHEQIWYWYLLIVLLTQLVINSGPEHTWRSSRAIGRRMSIENPRKLFFFRQPYKDGPRHSNTRQRCPSCSKWPNISTHSEALFRPRRWSQSRSFTFCRILASSRADSWYYDR